MNMARFHPQISNRFITLAHPLSKQAAARPAAESVAGSALRLGKTPTVANVAKPRLGNLHFTQ